MIGRHGAQVNVTAVGGHPAAVSRQRRQGEGILKVGRGGQCNPAIPRAATVSLLASSLSVKSGTSSLSSTGNPALPLLLPPPVTAVGFSAFAVAAFVVAFAFTFAVAVAIAD